MIRSFGFTSDQSKKLLDYEITERREVYYRNDAGKWRLIKDATRERKISPSRYALIVGLYNQPNGFIKRTQIKCADIEMGSVPVKMNIVFGDNKDRFVYYFSFKKKEA